MERLSFVLQSIKILFFLQDFIGIGIEIGIENDLRKQAIPIPNPDTDPDSWERILGSEFILVAANGRARGLNTIFPASIALQSVRSLFFIEVFRYRYRYRYRYRDRNRVSGTGDTESRSRFWLRPLAALWLPIKVAALRSSQTMLSTLPLARAADENARPA
ncbi:MAG: hypothetical protein BWY71_02244 [Planctomycetes bacterium ADurb.Bin412]|nr:MAG: hypothetical protein BWY71_02244 [Planctomycetes bacterium ADurb.Bin412]